MVKFNHPYHLVTLSPWPFMCSLSLMIFMMGNLKIVFEFNFNLMILGLILILMNLCQWWRDVIRESTIQGLHTIKVLKGLQNGMILFILSEMMFFFLFFGDIFMYIYHLELMLEEFDIH